MNNLRRQLYGLVIFRLLAATSLLISQVFLQAVAPGPQWNIEAFLLTLSAPYVFTFLYLILFKAGLDDRIHAHFQFLVDVVVISAILFLTGGLFSPFAILYFVVVITAAMLLYRQGALVVASESFVGYGVIVLLTYWAFLPTHEAFDEQLAALTVRDAYFWLFLYMFGLYAVAYLTSALSESVRGERTRAERSAMRVRQLEEFHRTLVESMTVGLLTTDEEGWISFSSAAIEGILGRTDMELEGKPVDDLLLGPGGFEQVRRELETERWVRRDLTRNLDSDREVRLGVTASRLGGPVAGYLFLVEDLTEFKRMEDELRFKDRMAALGEMAAGLAHEIRNPLASMTGSVEVLGKDLKLDGDQGRLLGIVLRESKRLDGIIRDFLDYARPPRLERRRFDLADLARETLDLFRNSVDLGEDVDLRLIAPEPVPCMGDPNQIRQVVWNLLRNSQEAMNDNGSLEIGVDRENSRVRLWVSDTGTGMSEEEQKAAVQPFRSGSGRGAGLGLTIVYRIIRDHDGDMRIQSRKGEGTRVVVYLPAGDVRDEAQRRREEATL